MTDCNWDHPGESRYTGTVAAAIASFRLPLAEQRALIDAWERRDFADHVVIDHDSIRGQRSEYAPDIRQMHFGSAGKVCDTVTRAGWTQQHVETALVVCTSGECIAVPAVCSNVFRLTRLARGVLPAAVVADDDVAPVSAPAYPTASPGVGPMGAGQPADAGPADGAFSAFGLAYPTGPYLAAPVVLACCGEPIAPAIPEPTSWALLALGLAAIASRLPKEKSA